MKKTNRIANFLLSLAPMPCAIGIQTAISFPIIALFIAYLIHAGQALSFTNQEELQEILLNQTLNNVISIVYATVIIIAFGNWLLYLRKKDSYRPAFRSFLNWQYLAAILLLVVGLQGVSNVVLYGYQVAFPKFFQQYLDLFEAAGFSDMTFFTAIYVILLGPVAEEIIFRGLTFRFARKALPFWVANCLQALLFGIYHMNLVQGTYAFLIGLVFGYIYGRCESLWSTILIHIFFNAFSLCPLYETMMDNELLQFFWIPLMIVTTILGFMLLYRATEVYESDPATILGDNDSPTQDNEIDENHSAPLQ